MIIAVSALWQFNVANWIYYFKNAPDFRNIMDAAIGFNEGKNFGDFSYFSKSPNNANLAIFLSWIYAVVKDWRSIIVLGAVLTNVSALLAALSIYNITANRFISLYVLVVSEILMAMNWRSFIVYTDTFGMILVALILWVYTSKISDKYKIPIVIVLSAMGAFIKVTTLLCFFSIVMHRMFYFVNEIIKNKGRTFFCVVFTGVVFVALLGCQNKIREYYGLELSDEYPKGWQYMFMVGQNTDAIGVTNGTDPQVREEVIEWAQKNGYDNSVVKQVFLDKAIDRIEERGFIGNIKYYIKKINVAYNDGYFHNVQSGASSELKRNLIYELLIREDGKFYQVSATVFQITWNIVLLFIILGVFWGTKDKNFSFFQILILGVTFYLMLFEGRSKYLYMFLPVYVVASGISMGNSIAWFEKNSLHNSRIQHI